MKKIIVNEELKGKEEKFRETCFGIVDQGDTFLCVLKDDTYSLIGGGLEEGETEEECLKREFLEEAGRKIKSFNKLCIVDCYWITRENKIMHSLSNIYKIEVTDEQLEILEKEHTLVEIPKKKIMNKLVLPYQLKGMEEYLK